MTIGAYGTTAFAVQSTGERFAALKSDIGTVQNQLASGQVATTYSGLGDGAATSLALRSRLGGLDARASGIVDGTLRVNLMASGLTAVDKLATSLSSSLPSSVSGTGDQLTRSATTATVSARAGLDTIVDVLNSELNGRYLFAGRAQDTEPVASSALILDGDSDHAGLKTLIAERQAADTGADGLGRLTLTASGSAVTLSEEATGLPFGLKIAGATATGTGVTAAVSSGPPASAGLTVASQPETGDSASVTLTLPDGTTSTVTLAAGRSSDPNAVVYAIGATTDETAANIRTALGTAVGTLGTTDLAAASAMKTATDFFAADAADPPARIAGPPFATATATRAGTSDDTVIWYRGESSATPRDGSPVRVSDTASVGIGAAANEAGFRSALAAFGVLAAQTFSASDTGRYAALAGRVQTAISAPGQTVKDIVTDFSLASASLKKAATETSQTKNQLTDTLSGIEEADPTETALKLVATQTRLQASYQTTSAILKLSLVDYL